MNGYLKPTGALIASLSVVVLAACSSSSSTAGANNSSTSTSSSLACGLGNGQKATGKPIEVRAIATESGGVDFSSSPKSANAFFDCVNDNGGINGRPIDYKVGDDGLDPAKTGQLASGYAADASVVAMVGDATFVGCAEENAAYKKASPELYSITGVGVPQSCFDSSNLAPVNAGPRISALAAFQYFERKGKANGFFEAGLNTPGNGTWVADGIKKYAAEKGITLSGNEVSDPATSDWTPLLNDVTKAKPPALNIVDPGPITAAILQAAEQQDAKGNTIWSCASSCYDTGFASSLDSYWNGFVVNSELQLTDAHGPDIDLWRAVMDKYAAKDAPRDTFSEAGFLAAKIFTDALLKIKDPSTINRQTASQAMLAVKGYKTDLLCAPWYYGVADAHHANHATRMAIAENGTWKPLEGCHDVSDPDMGSIVAAEKSKGLLKP